MIGLLWKDMIYIKKMWKTFATFSVLFMLFGFTNKDNFSSMTFIAILLGSNFSMLPFNYDNYSKWNEYQYAFPVSKKEVVCSRYLFGMIIFCICLLLSLLGILINTYFFEEILEKEFVSVLIGTVFVVPIMQALVFPLMYRFGAERGRIYAVVFFAILIAIIAGGKAITTLVNVFYGTSVMTVMGAMMVFSMIVYVLSLLLSIRIEQKKY